jgi:hypothetical protein
LHPEKQELHRISSEAGMQIELSDEQPEKT